MEFKNLVALHHSKQLQLHHFLKSSIYISFFFQREDFNGLLDILQDLYLHPSVIFRYFRKSLKIIFDKVKRSILALLSQRYPQIYQTLLIFMLS